ncbi:MAG: hypothetical protein JW807_17050 [Spirochaetes bacterium]|nr:hypothetical protein [Spirochaetota bacterium]
MKKFAVPMMISAALLFAVASFAEIRVVSVKGTAAYKAGGQWVPLKAGAVLAVGTKISTGVRSTVVININKNLLTVNPLTIMKISDSKQTARTSTTRIGLRRGSVRAKTNEDARIKTVFKVSTPVATSSVRGCEHTTGYGPSFGGWIIVHSRMIEGEGLNSGGSFLTGNLTFRQRPNSGSPDNVMGGMQGFLTNTYSKFITIDEETAYNLFGDDFQITPPTIPGGSSTIGGMVPVRVYLVWPSVGAAP